jgi:GNAT superfamily N-acetyltransferase
VPTLISIRPLAPSDSLEDITLLLHRAYAQLAAMGLNYTAVDQSVEVTKKRFEGGQGFVALRDCDIIGTIVVQSTKATSPCMYFRKAGVCSIHQFGVEPSLQGSGVGRSLIAACEAWARDNSFTEIALDTAEQATHLIALYSRLGYTPRDFVQWDGKVYRSIVMSKPIHREPKSGETIAPH